MSFIAIAIVLSVFAVRLFELQGLDASAYVSKAKAEGDVTVTLPATRGQITDRNGAALAESIDGEMIVADPTLTRPHAAAIAKIFANRLHLDYFDVLQRLRAPNTHFQYIARHEVRPERERGLPGPVLAAAHFVVPGRELIEAGGAATHDDSFVRDCGR